MDTYRDRAAAGIELARHLLQYRANPRAIVLALPRGGVPVGYEVASALEIPLDAYIVRKLGVPGHEELAMGAVASDGSYVADPYTIERCGVTPAEFDRVLERERAELGRREQEYRDGRPPVALAGRTAIVVDDGMATGASMISVVRALRQQHPSEIIVAVPVASSDACAVIERIADDVVCPWVPDPFLAVGLYYADFGQVSDEDVRALLRRAGERHQWTRT